MNKLRSRLASFLFTVVGIILISVIHSCNHDDASRSYEISLNYPLSDAENAFLDSLQYRTFLYFTEQINPDKGLVKDRTTDDSPATIAAMGWAIPCWAIGAEKNWISREKARELTLNMLRFLLNSKQSPDPVATGYKGFYYHFLDMQVGLRTWDSELSSVDTAWLLGGIRFAVQYYDGNHPLEEEIRRIGELLTARVEWEFLTMPDTGKYAGTVSMGWTPEEGLHAMGWIGYNEALYLYILAAGSGYGNASRAYEQWLNNYQWQEAYPGLAHAAFPPLFGHQYTQLFLDLRGLKDRYMHKKGIDYFENSRRATLVNRQYAIDNPRGWTGYDSLTWGISACDGPGPEYNFDDKQFWGYAGRGTSGPDWNYFDDGTLTPTALLGSLPFAAEVIMPTVMSLHQRFGGRGLWGRYGMVDAFNLTVDWFDTDYLGLDQGPIVIMIENFRSGLIWEYCIRDPVIQNGLRILDFRE